MRYLMPLVFVFVLLAISEAKGATYFVDFSTGADTNAGTSKDAPWKHAPGDAAATGKPNEVKLAPGDTVKFKGGVVYRGSITLKWHGKEGAPVVYDGDHKGDWGEGKAIIDGSVPLKGLKACQSAEEAWGNPNFNKIYWTTVPKGVGWRGLNLSEGTDLLAISQDPNPGSPIYQEDLKYYHRITTEHTPKRATSLKVRPLNNMRVNVGRPLIAMFDGGPLSAVIENISNGGEVEVVLPEAATVTAFSVTPMLNYTNPKEMAFLGDGKEILKVELEPVRRVKRKTVVQRFKLPAPATFKTLVIRFISAQGKRGGKVQNWGAVQQIAAYDQKGKNVLLARQWGRLRNDEVFNQKDKGHYENAFLGVHTSPNFVYFKRIFSFDPEKHVITFEPFSYKQKPYSRGGAFAIFNSPHYIDKPGEYALILKPEEDGSHKVLVWPYKGTEGLTRAAQKVGIAVQARHVAIQGFWIRKQVSTGVSGGMRKGEGLVVRDCKISHLRGKGIHFSGISNVLVENCEVTDNPGHAKGILIRNARNIVVRGCTLRRNSSTALDYYTVTNGVVSDCLVDDNRGMHANGLTFYVNCADILVERNHVKNGNVGLTLHGGKNMIIRNNIIEGGKGGAYAIGLWNGPAYDNIVITNNVLRHYGKAAASTAAALYGGNPRSTGYAVVNNVIDGLAGNVVLKADYHHNIFTKFGPGLSKAQLGDNMIVEGLERIFVDPDKDDYRLKAGSPAIGAGVELTTINRWDRIGVDRFSDKKVDIGAYEFVPVGAKPELNLIKADPKTHRFTFDGYEIAPPKKIEVVYKMRFKRREGVDEVKRLGVDRTGEGGGKVNLRPTKGGYISGWGNPGHWLEWTVEVKEAGAYEVAIVHGSEMPGKRQVLVNGEQVKGLEEAHFPATGAWVAWQEMGLPIPLMLKAGKNVIRFVNVTGHHNFKILRFIPVDPEKPAPDAAK